MQLTILPERPSPAVCGGNWIQATKRAEGKGCVAGRTLSTTVAKDGADVGDEDNDGPPELGDSDDEENVPQMPMDSLSRSQRERRLARLEREEAE